MESSIAALNANLDQISTTATNPRNQMHPILHNAVTELSDILDSANASINRLTEFAGVYYELEKLSSDEGVADADEA